ncbi:MAG TPA: phospholipase A [Flavobacteriales bacterium]|nr:phospholipase A [Flavobacteriales bacterium]
MMTFMGRSYRRLPLRYSPHPWRWLGFTALLPALAIAQSQNRAFTETHTLRARWELADSLRNGNFLITPYKPVYVLPAVWSSTPNRDPRRTNGPDPTGNEELPLDVVECKFQFSFKTKVLQGLYKNKGDIWVAYTQSSRWQVYNYGFSRSFRETNYEPEVMLVWPTKFRVLGFTGRMLSAGIDHQSNGGVEPYSRSWNRLIAQVGLERGRCTLLLRPWWRFPESENADENAGITGLLGNGEVIAIYQVRSHVISLQLRSAFIDAPFTGGSVQGDWSFTIKGHLKAHLQVFHGYGESLIDYDHRQTTIGLGVSLLDWL